MASEEHPADAPAVAVSHCDVCSVARERGTVVIHFGEHLPFALYPDTAGVELRHRVVLGEDTAHRLQELMAALLDEGSASRDGAR